MNLNIFSVLGSVVLFSCPPYLHSLLYFLGTLYITMTAVNNAKSIAKTGFKKQTCGVATKQEYQCVTV